MKNLTQKLFKGLQKDKTRYNEIEQASSRLLNVYDNDRRSVSDHLIQGIINYLLIGVSNDIDLLETLENYFKGPHIKIWVPIMPPGINSTYGVRCSAGGQRKIYKTRQAKEWELAAKPLVINAARLSNFEVYKTDKLNFEIVVKNSRHDVDAHIKLIVDTVCKNLGVDDKIVQHISSEVIRENGESGVLIEVEKI